MKLNRFKVVLSATAFLLSLGACDSSDSDGGSDSPSRTIYNINTLPELCTEYNVTPAELEDLESQRGEGGQDFQVIEGFCPDSHELEDEDKSTAKLLGRCVIENFAFALYDKAFLDVLVEFSEEDQKKNCETDRESYFPGTWVPAES